MERQSEKLEKDLNEFEFGINKCKLEDFLSYGTINELSHYLANKGYTKQEWISVEDRLPEKQTAVLVCFDNDCISTDFIASSGMWYDHWHKTITHWMPLPTPPKMKGAE